MLLLLLLLLPLLPGKGPENELLVSVLVASVVDAVVDAVVAATLVKGAFVAVGVLKKLSDRMGSVLVYWASSDVGTAFTEVTKAKSRLYDVPDLPLLNTQKTWKYSPTESYPFDRMLLVLVMVILPVLVVAPAAGSVV